MTASSVPSLGLLRRHPHSICLLVGVSSYVLKHQFAIFSYRNQFRAHIEQRKLEVEDIKAKCNKVK
eukprot:CAMPEP_0168607546 /NCGR_PEP_ID=MMETSP0449_2-20121227/111_1 /TAXON_ID=1082188 /ORGANISM="Strombidium rassoulzadegani, Strain ras09" /LENGTH=65 /DNA_ID=CAMNT_0008647391 /DNA_START=13 /DNA_END=210 /DNA_ORIENTATION=-